MVVVSLAFNPPQSLLSLYLHLPLSPSLIFPFPGHHIFVYVTHLLSLYFLCVSYFISIPTSPLHPSFPSLSHSSFLPFLLSFYMPSFPSLFPSLPAFPPLSSFLLFPLPSFLNIYMYWLYMYVSPFNSSPLSLPLPQVVAPVRATCAQVLGIVCHQLEASRVGGVIDTLLTLVRQDMWEVRHAALMGIQHLLASRMVLYL